MNKLVIFGAGGFGKEVASVINKINEIKPVWDLIGFIDDGITAGTEISKFGKVLGGVDYLNNFDAELNVVFAIGNPKILKLLVDKIVNKKIIYPNIIHPEVYIADKDLLKIGIGNVIVRACSFSVDVEIGNFNQFNSISSLAHDVKVGDFNVFMPLTRVSGGAVIGNFNLFGIGTVILQNLIIGNSIKTTAGSYLFRNAKDGFIYSGNPAKKFDI